MRVESCLWVGWGQLRAGGPGLWGHAKEGFLCMGKGILGGSDRAPPHQFILSENQVKLQQGEFYAAQKVFTRLLCGHRTCTRLANTGDAGGSVPALCQPHTLRSPVGQQQGQSQPARLCISGQTGEEGEAPRDRLAWRGAGRGQRRRPGLPLRSVRRTRFLQGPTPHGLATGGATATRSQRAPFTWGPVSSGRFPWSPT